MASVDLQSPPQEDNTTQVQISYEQREKKVFQENTEMTFSADRISEGNFSSK